MNKRQTIYGKYRIYDMQYATKCTGANAQSMLTSLHKYVYIYLLSIYLSHITCHVIAKETNKIQHKN